MDIDAFIIRLAEALDIEDASRLTPKTAFHDLDEWDSISLLSVIAMLDEEFGIQIEMNEFKELKTIEDLFMRALTS